MVDTSQKRRWMPVVLGLSLALNLAVVAAVAGAVWRHNGAERGGPRASRGGGALYIQALPRETQRAIREQMRSSGVRGVHDVGPMLAALRQEPFDQTAAVRELEAQRDSGMVRRAAATQAWLDEVVSMSPQERRAYADRLQRLSSKHGKARHKPAQ